MMKVYLLKFAPIVQQHVVIGIYSTMELAEAACMAMLKKKTGCCRDWIDPPLEVKCVELDDAPQGYGV